MICVMERVFSRTLFSAINELLNGGNAVVRHVVVICHGLL